MHCSIMRNCRVHMRSEWPMALWGYHWRRLVKNIGWANQNIGEQMVVKSDKCMGVSQLLVASARAAPPPKSTPMRCMKF